MIVVLFGKTFVGRQRCFGDAFGGRRVHRLCGPFVARRCFAFFARQRSRFAASNALFKVLTDLVLTAVVSSQLAKR